jgi:pimeloyl-ACP methyl ester carboxylesterase
MPEASKTPTVVLVHGAFADSSSWSGVIERLQAADVPVIAPANPLRGVTTDSEYLANVLHEVQGPIVLVGHSYGGAVISNAAAQAPNVVGLVFVAAFAPDEGETLGEATPTSKDAILGSALVQHAYNGTVEFSVDPAEFQAAFAADLPAEQAAVMAATQRPVAAAGFSDASAAAAWKQLPSWAVVGTADKAAGADLTRSMAERAGAKITEVDASHVVMVSQPQAVADVILDAVAATGQEEQA